MRVFLACSIAGLVALFASQRGVTSLEVTASSASVQQQPSPLIGLWSREAPPTSDDSPVAFYYFHAEQGIGLYRHGKLGHNTTHSYDWSFDDDKLALTYRKTGEVQQLSVVLDASNNTLLVKNDPRWLGQDTRYTRVINPNDVQNLITSTDLHSQQAGRMWIHLEQFATGGQAFSLYQLRPAGIDGRGTGWHHVGDFDDWSTEALSYRITSTGWDLAFALNGQRMHTEVRQDVDNKALWLVTDPRGFWAPRRYVDAGPSFGEH
jgi:hypothetical protein